MAERHLILCDGVRRADAPRAWWRAEQLPLEIGAGADVHLAVRQLNDRLCAHAPPECLDLLEIAAFVFAADQSVTRGGTARVDYGDDWRRQFRFEVPVRCPDLWNRPDVRAELVGALEFLTDDVYEFGFHAADNPRSRSEYLFEGAEGHAFDEVALFSGGLDSLCGAADAVLARGRRVLLVSHRSSTRVGPRQKALFDALCARVPRGGPRPAHAPVTVNKGEELNREFSQRSRSFVFASVAAVLARLAGLDRVTFYENGVTSLNLPVSPELVGARASRTTHPQSLARFARLFRLVFDRRQFEVVNPFQERTKAELLRTLKARGHADLAALTCSCGTVWGAEEARPHCGLCSQCVDRRLSALAAALSDAEDPPERYACDPLVGPRSGPELTLAERYVGTAREATRLATPRAFAVRFPEVNAALPHLGTSAAAAAGACHELYRRHADGVERALRAAFARVDVFDWRAVPPHSLLGVVQGRGAAEQVPPAPAAGAPPETGFVVDPGRFEVRYNGTPRPFGNTKEFHFIARLARARGVYLSLATLGEDVWEDAGVRKNTVHAVAASARRCLAELGLPAETIDGSSRGHYRLLLAS